MSWCICMAGTQFHQISQHEVAEAKLKYLKFLRSQPRYIRKGECKHCGWCCMHEDCPYLEWKDGKSHCTVHGTDLQPPYCKSFPDMPPIKNEKCGYYFIDKWDNNKRLKPHEV